MKNNRYIPDHIIDDIRSRSDLAEVIGSYLPLNRAGSNYKALCPFHQEKTPSFVVNPARQTFHCFGCGKGGDVFRFIMEKEGVDFPNAIHLLAQKYSIIIPEETSHSEGTHNESFRVGTNQRERLYSLHEEICAWFQKNLHNNPDTPVAQYFASRKIPMDTAQKFRLGAAPDSWSDGIDFLKQKGYSEEEILSSGVAVESEKKPGHLYDRFRNRLIFPIWNEQEKVVAFSARSIEKNPQGGKYVNSPETPIFQKSKVLYALPLARQMIRQKGFVVLCEGQIDVIAMFRAGFECTVAPQGTAFTDEQARILKRYTDRLFLAFDADKAGIKAIIRAFAICLPIGFEINVLNIPEGLDPDEIYNLEGEDGIKKLIESASDFFDFLLTQSMNGVDSNSSWDINRVTSEILEHVAKIDSSVTRSLYAGKLARRLNIPENAVFNELNKKRKADNFQKGRAFSSSPTETVVEQKQEFTAIDSAVVKAEETLLELALAHGTVGKRLSEELPSEMISKTPVGKVLEQVIQLTLIGEWENATQELLENLHEKPSPVISRILTKPNEYDHEQQEKAVSDCVKIIRKSHIQNEINILKNKLQNTVNNEEKTAIRQNFHEKCQERNRLIRS